MTEFSEKLLLVLIQYLAVALVVAFAGFLFSRSLEHYKAREAVAHGVGPNAINLSRVTLM